MEAYEKLESEFGDFVNMRQGEMVACASGTAALHLALEALELPQGSKCLMSDYNMIACPRAATLAGLVPAFVDCNEELLLDAEGFGKASYYRQAKVVIPVHIYGRRCDMKSIMGDADLNEMLIVEDMAEIHGVSPHPETDAACWSFYKNKIISCPDGEGGMVWFKDPARAKIARELRSLGFTSKHDYLHKPRGHNYRLSNVHAELILKSLMRFSENNARRNQIEDWYDKYLPDEWRQPIRDAVWVYDLMIPDLGYQRLDFIVRELNQQGIAARHFFKPMSSQEEYKNILTNSPNATKASKEGIYLPVYPEMKELDIKRNVTALIRAVDLSSVSH